MPKQIDKTGRLWYETKEGETRIGFTEEFLQQMQDCFHIVPGKQRTTIRQDGPLMAIETNECLFSIRAPVSGIITFFNTKAQDFPEKLTVDEVVCVLSEKKKEQTTTTKSAFVNIFADQFVNAAGSAQQYEMPLAPIRAENQRFEARRAAWRLVDQGVMHEQDVVAGWGDRPEGM